MRLLLIRSLLLVLSALAAWLLFGPKISALLDRFFTVADATLPVGHFELDSSQFTIGPRRWWVTPDMLIAPDSGRRVTLSAAGRTFTFGPILACSAAATGSCFEFSADPGDELSFVKSRSWLAWPTPFQYSIMGAPMTSWRRHAYHRLLWRKSSGAAIEMVWRDEQGFHATSGWTDGNLQIAPIVTITPSPFEAAVVRYLSQKKGWSRNEYRLESRGTGTGADRQCDVTAAIYLKDLAAAHPGAGHSVHVCVERSSGQVIREVGAQ